MRRVFLSLTIMLCSLSVSHGQELVPVLDKATHKYGYKEKDNDDWSLQPVYEMAHHFQCNVAEVRNENLYYFIDLHLLCYYNPLPNILNMFYTYIITRIIMFIKYSLLEHPPFQITLIDLKSDQLYP